MNFILVGFYPPKTLKLPPHKLIQIKLINMSRAVTQSSL